MSMVALFGELRKHELEFGWLNEEEDQGKKNNLNFKFEVERCKIPKEDEDSNDKTLSHVIRKSNRFMKSKGKG